MTISETIRDGLFRLSASERAHCFRILVSPDDLKAILREGNTNGAQVAPRPKGGWTFCGYPLMAGDDDRPRLLIDVGKKMPKEVVL